MKIAVVQDFLRVGGTETQSVFLANAFAAAGLEVTLFTFRPGGPLEKGIQPVVRRVSLQPLDTRISVWAPGLSKRLHLAEPDIVLCMGRMANNKGGALTQGFRVVATARTGTLVNRGNLRAYQRAAAVVCNANWTLERLANAGVPREKLEVIPNAFTRSWSREELETRREQMRRKLSGETIVFTCVAAFRSGKGQERLLRAFARAHLEADWRLWLVGDGPERRKCEGLARRLGLRANVDFMGTREPLDALAGADVFVFGSEAESLPNALIEAQWAGLPIVAYAVGGVGETFEAQGSGFLIPDGDESAFANAVESLAHDESQRMRQSVRAREVFDERFGGGSGVEAWLSLFERLL